MGSRSTAFTFNKDYRVDLAGASVGQVASPGSVIGNPGSIAVGAPDYGNVNVNLSGKFKAGMSGAEVKDLLGQQASLAGEQLGKVTDFGTAAFGAVNAARARELAAETGTGVDWKQLAPLIVLGVVIVWAARGRRKG